MINIFYSNNSFMVFSPDDWIILRAEFRIIGTLIGGLPALPRQSQTNGLPLLLLPEQVELLVTLSKAQVLHLTREICLNNPNKDDPNSALKIEILNEIVKDCEIISLEQIQSKTNRLRFHIFQDLWNKGLYITDGISFGGDFLTYLGDPIEFHASYIVKCLNSDENSTIRPIEIIGLARLANNVKKKLIFASTLTNNQPTYTTFTWNCT